MEECISVKATSGREHRRFLLKGQRYETLLEHLRKTHEHGVLTVQYRDDEGDLCSITNDLELSEAILLGKASSPALLRLEILQDARDVPCDGPPATDPLPVAHPGIKCDCCRADIVGARFKCANCADYDLCERCEQQSAHGHADMHVFIKIVVPIHLPFGVILPVCYDGGPGEDALSLFPETGRSQGRSDAGTHRNQRLEEWASRRRGGAGGAGPPGSPRGRSEFRASSDGWRGDGGRRQGRRKLSSKFSGDKTVQDASELAPHTKFTKVWSVLNNGNVPWPTSSELQFVGGDQMGAAAAVAVPSARVGEAVDVAVDLVAPAKDGRYRGYWRLGSRAGRFGTRLWVDVMVVGTKAASKAEGLSKVGEPVQAASKAGEPVQAASDAGDTGGGTIPASVT